MKTTQAVLRERLVGETQYPRDLNGPAVLCETVAFAQRQ